MSLPLLTSFDHKKANGQIDQWRVMDFLNAYKKISIKVGSTLSTRELGPQVLTDVNQTLNIFFTKITRTLFRNSIFQLDFWKLLQSIRPLKLVLATQKRVGLLRSSLVSVGNDWTSLYT